MFLLVTVIFSTLCYIIYKIVCTVYNAKDIKDAEKDNKQFVYMADGTIYDRENHILGNRSTTINGERVMINWLGKVTHNYSLDERKKIKEWLLDHGYVVTTEYIPAQNTCLNTFRNGKYIGERYKDLNTGEEYIIQSKNGNRYYLSLSTAMYVRLIDEDINEYIHFLKTYYPDISNDDYESKMEYYLNTCKIIMEKHNQEQARKKKAYSLGNVSISSLFDENHIVKHDELPCFARQLIN